MLPEEPDDPELPLLPVDPDEPVLPLLLEVPVAPVDPFVSIVILIGEPVGIDPEKLGILELSDEPAEPKLPGALVLVDDCPLAPAC